jgi:translocation and assembly module TamB
MARRLSHRLAVLVAGLALLLGAYGLFYALYNGPGVTETVRTQIRKQRLCGRIELGEVRWSFLDPGHARVRELRIVDPAGRDAIVAPTAEVDVELMPLRHGEVRLHHISPGPGTRVFIDLDPWDGFFATFAPCRERGTSEAPSAATGPHFHLDGLAQDVAAGFRIGTTLEVRAPHAASAFTVDLGERRPRISLAPQARGGTVLLFGVPLGLDELTIRQLGTTAARPDDLQLDLSARLGEAQLHLGGALLHAFDRGTQLDLSLEIDHAGSALGQLVAGLTPLVHVGGALAHGRIHLGGPSLSFRVDAELGGLTAELPQQKVRASDVGGRLTFATDSGRLDIATASAHLLLGTVSLEHGVLDPAAGTFGAQVKLARVNLAPLLPPERRAALAGTVDGRARLKGHLPDRLSLADLDLTLERTSRDTLPRRIVVGGAAELDLQRARLHLDPLAASSKGLSARATGSVGLQGGALDLTVSGQAAPLAPILAALGVPPDLVRSARADGRLTGSIDHPNATGTVELADLGVADLRIPRTTLRIGLSERDLRIADLTGSGPFGQLDGQGHIDLSRREGALRVGIRDLDLSRLGLELSGRAQGALDVAGSPAAPTGSLKLGVDGLTIAGAPYQRARLSATLTRPGVQLGELALARTGGGELAASGMVGWDGRLSLHVDAARFPLQALPGLTDLPVAFGGLVSGSVDLGGTVQTPLPSGTVKLESAWIRRVALGDGTLTITPGGDAVHLQGRFFKTFLVEGTITISPAFALTATITFQGLKLEQLLPELAKLGEVRGVASGRVDLSVTSSGAVHVAARLSELRLGAHVTDDEGRPRQLDLVNSDEVRVVYDGRRIRFDSLHLLSRQGELEVLGYLDPEASALDVRGQLDLELIEFFAHQIFDHTHGHTVANLHVAGPLKRPVVTGTLALEHVLLKPIAFDHRISIPSGRLTFSNQGVDLEDLVFGVGEALARAHGHLGLSDWHPGTVHLEVAGKLSAKLLELVAPTLLGEVQGAVDLNLVLDGPAQSPTAEGRLSVAEPGIELEVRHYGRHVRLIDAEIVLSKHRLAFRPGEGRELHVKIDDGDLRLAGYLALVGYSPHDVHLAIRANDLPHGVPRVYEVTVGANLRLTGGAEGLALAGDVDIVDGRYVQQFELLKNFVIRPRVREESSPFWKDVPLLEDLALDLNVNSTGPVFVDNDLAHQLKLESHLQVGGSLSDPRIGGEITVLEGTFRIPFLRGDDFVALPGGTVRFYQQKPIPDESPELTIQAEKTFLDANEQDHLVTLTIRGPLGALVWDLSTNTGLNRAQTFTLLTTGRPPSELRSELRGSAPAGTTGSAGGSSAFDQSAKEVTGTILFQELLSDPIKQLLHLDAFNFYVGPESAEFKFRWRLSQYPRTDLSGQGSKGFVTRSTIEGRLELKLHDYVFLDSQVQHYTQGPETEEDSLTRLKLQGRLKLRLRF